MSRLESTRKAAGEAIRDLIRENKNIAVVSADTYKSMYTNLVLEEFPERFVDVGIAEQNMMMVAAGLASTGITAFATSYSTFLSMRCCEQLRTFIAYPNANVKVIAGLGGLSGGIEGATHVATEDLGILRCLPNLAVIAPCDANTVKLAVNAAAEYDGPVYIRVGRDPSKVLTDGGYRFEIGKPAFHARGDDITLIGCGIVMEEVIEAAGQLGSRGIRADVLEVHTLKPMLDGQSIVDSIRKTGRAITVEEHNVTGGLATVIAEVMQGKGCYEYRNLGLQDCYSRTGTPGQLRAKYHVDRDSIVSEACRMLNKN